MDTITTHADTPPAISTNAAEHVATPPPRTVTIREAAELAGTTRDAIRGRVERGSLQSVLGKDGARRIPVSELRRAGLLDDTGSHAMHHVGAHGVASVGGMVDTVEGVGVFVAALDRMHAENVAAVERAVAAETRLMLEQRTASTVELELFQAQARIVELEQQLEASVELPATPPRRTWFGMTRHRAAK